MATLQMQPVEPGTCTHSGEVFSCAYSPDGALVLSAGWDGHLRLWEAASGAHVRALSVGSKPLSACAISPDGKQWLSGSLDGMLAFWDPLGGRQVSTFLAHTRPLSAILFSLDGKRLITASWDRTIGLWKLGREREAHTFTGHEDIVAGCRLAPDGGTLLSWSHDCTLRTWDLARPHALHPFTGHRDRVTAGAVSPDGCWVASGSRDGAVHLWDLRTAQQTSAIHVGAEVRGCFFLPDGTSLVVVDKQGRVSWHALPSLEIQAELKTSFPVQTSELAPSGKQVVLGCDDGLVRFIAVQGFEQNPLLVTPIQSKRRIRTMLDRLLGRSRLTDAYSCNCPACGQTFDLPSRHPGQPASCPHCRRNLRQSSLMRVAADA